MRDHLKEWFVLKHVPGIGNLLYKRLIEHFGSPAQVLTADAQALATIAGISPPLAHKIQTARLTIAAKRELDRLAASQCQVITLADPAYPPLLKEIPDPPPWLYSLGRLPTEPPLLAVVGARRATHYGLDMTQRLCRDLAVMGFVVVSGMARGIDTAAHRGALLGGGRTVAVLGSGLGRIYPRENMALSRQIAQQGAVITEFSLDSEPEAHNFPRRNRIISGMCVGTLVVEAARKSGSLITARLSAEQGREVFAVPGSVQSHHSTGTHHLIKQGAKLVESIQDILDELPYLTARLDHPEPEPQRRQPPTDLSADEKAIYGALGPYPQHIDEVSRRLAMEARTLSSALLRLELKGLVQQYPGKKFALKEGDA